VISGFGVIGKGRKNDGINISAARGTTVKAADKGTVAYAGNELKGFGNLILIKHSDGWITAYAHNEKLLVKKGQTVLKGEKIATVGSTGGVNAPQLHFEVRAGKKAVNPKQYLP
jgi:murein DD-endopeptidase MepM/ murein hydrolase activator NlpD